ncbi:integrator complex subunit 6 homolog isoform X4 [Glossina fuscipes]|uniref:Nuclear protein MDM1 n=1 Tax=Glossina fuscipes TaxID=7396 RepID=A0A9C5YXT3_9MUSC|nr:integrator complex subunit 6 homolog isoform X4 [Glossina fuscipes]
MIGSFWNLCRACPSMPVDKLHSEYRSTYRWHEFTGSSRPEVVRRAPAPNPSQFVGATNEPPIPRRKKCPELAYKSHEFIIGSEYTDARNNAANRMPRSEERGGTPSRRSKSEGPPAVPNGRAYPISTDVDGPDTKQAGESSQGLFKKTISKLSTEYRLQFVWPNVRRIKGPETQTTTATTDQPKKSISMGAIRGQQAYQQQQQQQQLHNYHQHHHHHHHYQQQHNHHQMMAAMPTVHKKRTTNQKEATLHELEPLVSDADDRKPIEKQVTIVERKVTARPFSQLIEQERPHHFITKKENYGFEKVTEVDNKQLLQEQQQQQQQEQQPLAPQQPAAGDGELIMNGSSPPHSKPNLDLWLKEVVELRKKAGEYKCRGWGIEIDPDLYKKQKDLWDQVSKNSSLSALSLASAMHRPITKEEKEQENNKKTAPLTIKPQKARVPGQAFFLDNKDEMHALPARFHHVRHHLERTTGPDVEEGALLPSPTREKLMPAITKRESESQRGSPKKTAASRHGSPQKGSPQKGSPKKIIKTRSQSVGPEHESPKRQIRSASTAPTARYVTTTAGKKTPTTAAAERKARPSTLSTTLHIRTKSSSLPPPPPSGSRAHANAVAAANIENSQLHANQSLTSTSLSKSPQSSQMRKSDKDKRNLINNNNNNSHEASNGSIVTQPLLLPPLPPPAPPPPLLLQHGMKIIKTPPKTSAMSSMSVIQTDGMRKIAPPSTLVMNDEIGGHKIGGDVGKTLALNRLPVPGRDKKLAENDGEDGRDTAISVSSCSPQPVPEVPEEPLVKSPPEPTRVKSPEQIIMRSPDPVNWTVPLDTGKTFTVTQNVKEVRFLGENYSRPQSEIKASTPVEKPPPPPQSAPPELTEQVKMDAWKNAHSTDTKASLLSSSSPTSSLSKNQKSFNNNHTNNNNNNYNNNHNSNNNNINSNSNNNGNNNTNNKLNTKPLPGTTIRVLEDPLFDIDVVMATSAASITSVTGGGNLSSSSNSTTTPSTARTTATDVLEKARDRFDRFWGGNNVKEESV